MRKLIHVASTALSLVLHAHYLPHANEVEYEAFAQRAEYAIH